MAVGMFLNGFEIWRPSRATDGKGGWSTEGAFALIATVQGRLSPLSAAATPRAYQERGVVALRFSTPFSTDIKAGDEVRKNGRVAKVDAVTITSRGTRKECVCEEVNDG
jgi:head-tail adaptor